MTEKTLISSEEDQYYKDNPEQAISELESLKELVQLYEEAGESQSESCQKVIEFIEKLQSIINGN